MKSNILALVLVPLVSLALCACSGKEVKQAGPEPPSKKEEKNPERSDKAAGVGASLANEMLRLDPRFGRNSGLLGADFKFAGTSREMLKLSLPDLAPYVDGRWGYTQDKAIIFKAAPQSYNIAALERVLIMARNRLFLQALKGDEYAVLIDVLVAKESLREIKGRKYQHWMYLVLACKKADAARCAEILESKDSDAEKAKRLAGVAEGYTQEIWFDISEVFNRT